VVVLAVLVKSIHGERVRLRERCRMGGTAIASRSCNANMQRLTNIKLNLSLISMLACILRVASLHPAKSKR
jgi:hypothetical protein